MTVSHLSTTGSWMVGFDDYGHPDSTCNIADFGLYPHVSSSTGSGQLKVLHFEIAQHPLLLVRGLRQLARLVPVALGREEASAAGDSAPRDCGSHARVRSKHTNLRGPLLDAVMGAYDRRLAILGFDDFLTRNARLAVDIFEDSVHSICSIAKSSGCRSDGRCGISRP